MRTVITKKIDGIEVIHGFSELSIEPVETRKIVDREIIKSPEFLECQDKRDLIKSTLRIAAEFGVKCRDEKNAVKKQEHFDVKTAREEQAKGYETELSALLPGLKKKRQDLTIEHAIYFEPKAGEYAKTEAEIQALCDVLDSVQGVGFVDLDGEIVEDNRGSVHCKKLADGWSIGKITVLGISVPKNAILYSDLDAAQKKAVDFQIEIDVASGLSAAEKVQARISDENKANADAVFLRSSLEIQGDADALEKSQAVYNSRMAEISEIYG